MLYTTIFFPVYINLVEKKMLPVNREATETTASVDLQELLNKTGESVVEISNIHQNTSATLVCKWGFDGSSGHSQYKQCFTDSENTDEFLFLIAMCPLKLVEDSTGTELWNTPRSSSTMYCRPIKFVFMKENSTLVQEEEARLNEMIVHLSKHCFQKNGFSIEISFKMLFTMIDGSVCNILSKTNAAAKCYICGATPKQMNREAIYEKPSNVENYRFGLSTLHCWIRCFECLLHISYRLPFKSWQVRDPQNKITFANRKKEIQNSFKTRMGLTVDKPKPGFGSSNDGNTARRFFANPKEAAEITGVSENLIQKFSIILRVIASGKHINIPTFSILLNETSELYLQLYSWYYMPSSVHKLLVHGPDIISFFEIPIGQLSEEALEASHKEFRRNRLNHTRKASRIYTNIDLMTVLLLKSDPKLSQHRHTGKYSKYFNSVLNLTFMSW